MTCYSIEFSVPDVCPFDVQAKWFQSFVGSVLLPVIDSGMLERFWFTRYGGVGKGKSALFRFETDHLQEVTNHLELLAAGHRLTASSPAVYDVAGDIGHGEGSRFLGTNAKHSDPARRGELALAFLHASACLMLDCLVGPDGEGYFALESEMESGFSKESSLEQFHHLFCNMTCCPTYVAIAKPPNTNDLLPVTYEEYKGLLKEPGWTLGNLRNGMY
jgi:hypothetical protein